MYELFGAPEPSICEHPLDTPLTPHEWVPKIDPTGVVRWMKEVEGGWLGDDEFVRERGMWEGRV